MLINSCMHYTSGHALSLPPPSVPPLLSFVPLMLTDLTSHSNGASVSFLFVLRFFHASVSLLFVLGFSHVMSSHFPEYFE
jgi:hypothetical protein